MTISDWAVAGVDAAIASLFANSGAAKLVVPGTLHRAVSELAPLANGRLTPVAVRGVAVTELSLAAAILVPAARTGAAVAVVVFGGVFAAFGALGLVRRSALPCGCLGGPNQHPLGSVNITLGLALAAAGFIEIVVAGRPAAASTVLLASIGSLSLCLWLHRPLIGSLLVPARPIRSGGGMR
jgi:hypothetical protein